MKTVNWMVAAAVVAGLTACGGAEEIASTGSGGNITINNNSSTSSSSSSSSSSGVALVTPAAGCPTIANPVALTDAGTITGPTGEYRVCDLPARLTANTTLERLPGLLYGLNGRVDVGNDLGAAVAGGTGITLTIQPGVIVFAKTGVSWLAVNRGNRLNAIGTAARPIVFTSRDNVIGLANDDSQGQWGGIVLLGRAPITDCTVAPSATPGTEQCERQTEGAVDPAYFGGATATDNSGTLRYVQIRYSGYVLSGNSELQSLTNGGVGSGTSISYIHSHNSSDDAFENFGGTVSMSRLVLTGADDDNIDADTGWKGRLQYVIAVQKTSGAADSIIELDSANSLEDQTPRTHLKLANFTFVHRNAASGNNAAMLFRGKADASLVNGVITSPMVCLRLNGTNILTTDAGTDKLGAPLFRSVVMQCNASQFVASGGLTVQQVSDTFGSGTNNNNASFTATLANTFVNGANETAVTATDPKTIDTAFDTTTYVGAVKDVADTWYAGWTCNSATANFGSTSASCISLPSLN
jgi:hypothetical protein